MSEIKFSDGMPVRERRSSTSIYPEELLDKKYVGCGDALFLSCSALDIFNRDLGTEDFNEAVSKAKKIIMCKVKKIREDACRFYSDNSIEFDRY